MSIVNFIFSYFFHTPKVFSLNRDNLELISKIEDIQDRINIVNTNLNKVSYRDNNIYRAILGVDSISKPNLDDFPTYINEYNENRYSGLIKQTWLNYNDLAEKVYFQSLAFDTLQYLSVNKGKMLESLPAIWPINPNDLTRQIGRYGSRIHPIFRYRHLHEGIDMPGKKGTPIYATANGKVIEVKWSGGYGKNIVIDHGFGYKTRYAHLNDYLVEVGDNVVRGMEIGKMGNTGNSTGSHLHYEVIHNGYHVNPFAFLGKEMKDEDFYNIINSAKETTYENDMVDETMTQ